MVVNKGLYFSLGRIFSKYYQNNIAKIISWDMVANKSTPSITGLLQETITYY
jgi:hypothetical protein